MSEEVKRNDHPADTNGDGKVSKEEHEQIANDAVNCVSKTFGAFFVPSLLEAELILKREDDWKKS